MNLINIPGELLALALLLVSTFSALIGGQITSWILRSRERALDDRQLALNVQSGHAGYGAPFQSGAVADLNRRASSAIRR